MHEQTHDQSEVAQSSKSDHPAKIDHLIQGVFFMADFDIRFLPSPCSDFPDERPLYVDGDPVVDVVIADFPPADNFGTGSLVSCEFDEAPECESRVPGVTGFFEAAVSFFRSFGVNSLFDEADVDGLIEGVSSAPLPFRLPIANFWTVFMSLVVVPVFVMSDFIVDGKCSSSLSSSSKADCDESGFPEALKSFPFTDAMVPAFLFFGLRTSTARRL